MARRWCRLGALICGFDDRLRAHFWSFCRPICLNSFMILSHHLCESVNDIWSKRMTYVEMSYDPLGHVMWFELGWLNGDFDMHDCASWHVRTYNASVGQANSRCELKLEMKLINLLKMKVKPFHKISNDLVNYYIVALVMQSQNTFYVKLYIKDLTILLEQNLSLCVMENLWTKQLNLGTSWNNMLKNINNGNDS